eukprot:Rhum_TRINITY_DN12692_c0_g1::Rhum_TRINITY_DN12692_c0_g1_i2::g.53671::m.53671
MDPRRGASGPAASAQRRVTFEHTELRQRKVDALCKQLTAGEVLALHLHGVRLSAMRWGLLARAVSEASPQLAAVTLSDTVVPEAAYRLVAKWGRSPRHKLTVSGVTRLPAALTDPLVSARCLGEETLLLERMAQGLRTPLPEAAGSLPEMWAARPDAGLEDAPALRADAPVRPNGCAGHGAVQQQRGVRRLAGAAGAVRRGVGGGGGEGVRRAAGREGHAAAPEHEGRGRSRGAQRHAGQAGAGQRRRRHRPADGGDAGRPAGARREGVGGRRRAGGRAAPLGQGPPHVAPCHAGTQAGVALSAPGRVCPRHRRSYPRSRREAAVGVARARAHEARQRRRRRRRWRQPPQQRRRTEDTGSGGGSFVASRYASWRSSRCSAVRAAIGSQCLDVSIKNITNQSK